MTETIERLDMYLNLYQIYIVIDRMCITIKKGLINYKILG